MKNWKQKLQDKSTNLMLTARILGTSSLMSQKSCLGGTLCGLVVALMLSAI